MSNIPSGNKRVGLPSRLLRRPAFLSGSKATETEKAVFYSPRNAAGAEAVGMREARSRSEAPMMLGLITVKDVLRHAPTIVRGFGAAAFLRCCLVILSRRRTTFLACIFPQSQQQSCS
jgi:hypothetical protein